LHESREIDPVWNFSDLLTRLFPGINIASSHRLGRIFCDRPFQVPEGRRANAANHREIDLPKGASPGEAGAGRMRRKVLLVRE
jgi:hypothetical protein